MNLNDLHQRGFDLSTRYRVQCSSCEALVINGHPCHETGCHQAMSECHGCNELVPVNRKYCEDCS